MDDEAFFEDCVRTQKFPLKGEKQTVILRRLMRLFPEEVYREVIVNEILGEHFEDVMSVRKALEQQGFMERHPERFEYVVKKRV